MCPPVIAAVAKVALPMFASQVVGSLFGQRKQPEQKVASLPQNIPQRKGLDPGAQAAEEDKEVKTKATETGQNAAQVVAKKRAQLSRREKFGAVTPETTANLGTGETNVAKQGGITGVGSA